MAPYLPFGYCKDITANGFNDEAQPGFFIRVVAACIFECKKRELFSLIRPCTEHCMINRETAMQQVNKLYKRRPNYSFSEHLLRNLELETLLRSFS